ncbi:laminin subunit gamma-1-like [Lineus longissimus]|uniref:laminin subunit gamma-1-like n=1 Tax=Lineus longissimus TaxID=88925 RepID=UPI002B4E1689
MAVRRKCPILCTAGRGFYGKYSWTITALVLGSILSTVHAQGGRSSNCYDRNGKPQYCMPVFQNAAFQNHVEATSTCGDPPTRFCTGRLSGGEESCSMCDSSVPSQSHPPRYLVDLNNRANPTWWQSETMFENVQFPNQVNITLNLGIAYDITYVTITFQSPRPESFAIYKRTTPDDDWVPYQYYSATCRATYGLSPDISYISRQNPKRALCSPRYSDIAPLSGGTATFSTLRGRPGAYNVDNSPDLQEFITATDIRIVLTRLNTFGDEVFGDKGVLQSYFYAISDIAVGARCKCNGHASRCVESTAESASPRFECQCEHKTTGPNCDECQPLYNDRPWARATSTGANECRACECNGLSSRCFFDKDLYETTGRGGHCLDCQDNTKGPQCETCLVNFYRRASDNRCVDCQCDPAGSTTGQCDANGQCPCKPGFTEEKCDAGILPWSST